MNQQTARVLIVDDDKNICAILAALMKKEGLEPMVAYDGEKALKMVQADTPDLLLVDMMLPGMDGMEVLRKTRELDPDLPVVFITASDEVNLKRPMPVAGCAQLLRKPFSSDELITAVRAAIPVQR